MDTQVDFKQIRPFDGDRRKGFEEFVCQLARRKPGHDYVDFRRIEGAGGDGGVEGYWLNNKGQEHGIQAKYFLATKDIDWGQIDKSVNAALDQHPTLVSYVVALACDLTDRSGAKGRGKTGWDHWDAHKKSWEALASQKSMNVRFSAWTKSDLVNDLASHADRRGLTLFWFNSDTLDEARLEALFERARADLGERFHPEDNVRTTLLQAFQGLRRSPAFVDEMAGWFNRIPDTDELELVCGRLAVKCPDSSIVALREVTNRLRSFGRDIERCGLRPYPVDDWWSAIGDYWPAASKVRAFLDGIDEPSERERDLIQHAQRYLALVAGLIDSRMPFGSSDRNRPPSFGADRTRCIIVQGEPGSGKSHLFADAVSSALKDKTPAVLMLGQHFLGHIRESFLKGLGMPNQDFEVSLQALNSAGELTGQRTLILIDALNEATDLRIWLTELAGFVNQLLEFEYISVGLSLRPEYVDILVPDTLKDSAEVLTHRGIQTTEEQDQAAIQYFEKRGIRRPTAPWLAPEFSNFLFLRTVCTALAATGQNEFPRGLRGSLDVLKYYLDSVDVKIRRDLLDANIPKDAAVRAVAGIANWMAERQRDSIDAVSATAICEAHFNSKGPTDRKSWFNVLASEGVFRTDHIFPAGHISDDPFGAIEEVARFSYQRFSDHLIVRALLNDIVDVRAAFSASGKLSYLAEDKNWRWSSLWQAIAVQIPEKFPGIEALDVIDVGQRALHNFVRSAFQQSLLWRLPTAFSDRTFHYFRSFSFEDQVEVVLRLSTVASHRWNADFLHRNLATWTLPNRDATWSAWLNRADNFQGVVVREIVRWCHQAPIERADDENLRLGAITLSWFLTSSSRPLRDAATKALIRVLSVKPVLGPVLLTLHKNVNDLYVLERVCCAIYAASARTSDKQVVGDAALAIYRSIFDRPDVPLNLSLRDYAKGVIDLAASQDCLPDSIDLERCKPPFISSWPIDVPTEEEVQKIADEAGDKGILHSAGGMGDFSRYEIEPAVTHFTRISLSEDRPLNAEEQKAEFETVVAGWPPATRQAYATFRATHAAMRLSMRLSAARKRVGIKFEYEPAAEAAFKSAESTFLSILNVPQLATFNALAKAAYYPDVAPDSLRELPRFDAEESKRWVIVTAYKMGWTSSLFSDDVRSYNLEGTRPKIERIGKKYQWLALRELQARLSDNVWAIRDSTNTSVVFDRPGDHWFVRDIEPSILIDPPREDLPNPWWLSKARPLDPLQGKVSQWPFSEKPSSGVSWLEPIDSQGKSWLLLSGFWTDSEKRSPGETRVLITTIRSTFTRVSALIVRRAEVDEAVEKMKGKRLADPTGHGNIEWIDGPFLLEYPWRDGWESDSGDSNSPFEKGFRTFGGIEYIRPVGRQVWESHLDASLSAGSSIGLLHPWIGRQLGVKPDLNHVGICRNAHGEIVFMDPAYGTGRATSGVVDPQHFFDFLRRNDLECIWLVAGERDSYPSGKHGDYHCRSFAGLYQFKQGRWVSEEWYEDASGHESEAE